MEVDRVMMMLWLQFHDVYLRVHTITIPTAFAIWRKILKFHDEKMLPRWSIIAHTWHICWASRCFPCIKMINFASTIERNFTLVLSRTHVIVVYDLCLSIFQTSFCTLCVLSLHSQRQMNFPQFFRELQTQFILLAKSSLWVISIPKTNSSRATAW